MFIETDPIGVPPARNDVDDSSPIGFGRWLEDIQREPDSRSFRIDQVAMLLKIARRPGAGPETSAWTVRLFYGFDDGK